MRWPHYRWRRNATQLVRLTQRRCRVLVFQGDYPKICDWLLKHPKVGRSRLWIEDVALPARQTRRG